MKIQTPTTLLILAALTVACDTTPNSQLKLVNGEVSTDPAFVQIVTSYRRTCTGTFLTDRVLLTAAHCVGEGPLNEDGSVDEPIYLSDKRIKSQAVYRNPAYIGGEYGMNNLDHDLAIAVFPPMTGRGTAKLATQKLAIGDEVLAAGFGPEWVKWVPVETKDETHSAGEGEESDASTKDQGDASAQGVDLDLEYGGQGKLRVGTNHIKGFVDGKIFIDGVAGPSEDTEVGTDVSAGPGDSGGFLGQRVDDQLYIYGVATTMEEVLKEGHQGNELADYDLDRSRIYYVDLSSESSQAFLKKVNEVIESLPPPDPVRPFESTQWTVAQDYWSECVEGRRPFPYKRNLLQIKPEGIYLISNYYRNNDCIWAMRSGKEGPFSYYVEEDSHQGLHMVIRMLDGTPIRTPFTVNSQGTVVAIDFQGLVYRGGL